MSFYKRLPKKVIATNVIGVLITILATALVVLFLSGCEPSRAEKERDEQKIATQKEAVEQVAQGATNLEPIGHHLETSGRSPEGQAIISQAELVMSAVKTLAKTMGISLDLRMPTVSYMDWAATKNDAAKAQALASKLGAEKEQMEAILAEKETKLTALQKVVDEEAKQGWWRFMANGAFWSSVAGIGLYAARLLNVPGIGILADPLMKLIGRPILKPIEEQSQAFAARASTASTAVMASDVARFALGALEKKLDPALAETLSTAISQLTGGKASGLEDVFRMVAKGVAIDEGKHMEVDALLGSLRAVMPTKLGEPDAVAHLFKVA